MSENKTRYNHAFSVGFSLDTDMTQAEYLEHMRTRKGLSELAAAVIRRALKIVEDTEVEAYDMFDSYEYDPSADYF